MDDELEKGIVRNALLASKSGGFMFQGSPS